jgi:endonuclease/exonuclease/phosphatase family metal-dependent hydrolase
MPLWRIRMKRKKRNFYDELEKTYEECPRSDVKLILGDFNAKVGCKDENKNTGKYGLHTECNDNGRRLVGFATSHGMMVGRTLFPHKDIHKAAWKSPNGTHRNQIDHILIDGRHRSNLLDVQVFRGPNMDSDHYLVMGKM